MVWLNYPTVEKRCIASLSWNVIWNNFNRKIDDSEWEIFFANKYRIQSARLQSWDYADEAMYFVTICTRNMENYFGEIVELPNDRTDAMHRVSTININVQLTEIGRIAREEWFRTPELRADMNVELGEFVVMPNHIHGIVSIGENKYNRRDAMHRVSTKTDFKNTFAPQSKNLSSIIRGYKSAVTTFARKNNIEFGWQPRFHEHIIRTAENYRTISEYIINNPAKWHLDKFFKA